MKRSFQIKLGIRWKLLFPFLVITMVTVFALLPMANRLIEERFQAEADRRLTQSALSVALLLEDAEEDAILNATFVSTQPEIQEAANDSAELATILPPLRDEIGLRELSFYSADYQEGDSAFFYGGPIVRRRLQVNPETEAIRADLIQSALTRKSTSHGITIAPQSSQIIGVAPVIDDDGEVLGAILAVFYLDSEYLRDISDILGVKIAIIKDNSVIASNLAPEVGYEERVERGQIDTSGRISAETVSYGNNYSERILAHPLILGFQSQGTVLVSQPIQDLLQAQQDIQDLVYRFAVALIIFSVILAGLIYLNFARPLGRIAYAAEQVSHGKLDQRAPVVRLLFRDEITELGENFNVMVERLQGLYTNMEELIKDRTRELLDERNKLRRTLEELEIARDQALAANRSKSIFLANMSHELRTPLNAIIGYTNLVTAGTYGPVTEKQEDRLQRVVDNGYHLLNLINDILDLSKIEAGKMELYLETFDVAHLLDNVISTSRPLMAKNQNQLETDLGHDLGTMYADLTKVRQVLFNLLSNAAKFTTNGTVTLEGERDTQNGKDWMIFRVRDTGIGMNADQLSKLFKEFSQADDSTTRKYGGTGLGLAISRRFCLMMGGDVTVSSELEVGSVFEVHLPCQVVPMEITPEVAEMISRSALPSPQHNRVLVIDDDAVARDLIEHYLAEEGFEVFTAKSGEEGLKLAKEITPTVITLDVMMANMDGWQVLTRLKGDPELAHIPVVMLTITDDRNLGYALGASDYITKPVDKDRLVSLLGRYLNEEAEGYRILLVEDEDSTRSMMSDLLQLQGWDIVEAINGKVALEKLSKETIHVILLDLMMPEMDGFEFIQTVRRDDTLKDIPVIVVTAMNLSYEDRLRLEGYIRKIVQKGDLRPQELVQEVRELARIREKDLQDETA